ncbi:tetratricopeptide repeat protein [Candidatus Woesearchaeota archaeon]|nr:tetratricopeptide repeat protein [Candidatus Woesearchaeota archaeon]
MKAKNFYVIAIILLCFLSYSNTLQNEFVWDDTEYIVKSTKSRDISSALSSFSEDEYGIYRPVRTLFYYMSYNLFGLNAFFYHLLSIILHTTATLLIFAIIGKLFNKKLAFLSSVLFAVHPIHVGRVANATASFDILGIIIYLAAFYLYIEFREKNSRQFLLFSIMAFIAGLFASEEVFSLPLLIILYEFVFRKKGVKKYVKSVSYFIILAAFLSIRFFVLDIASRVTVYPGGSPYVTFLTMPKVLLSYIFLAFFPVSLTPFRNVEYVYSLASIWFILPVIIIAAIAYEIYKNRKSKKVIFFSGFFIITMLPFLNILPLQKIMAERYFYLASLSILVLPSQLALFLEKKTSPKTAYSIFSVIILIFLAMTIYNNTFWKNELTLMTRGIEINPASSKAHDNLGTYYFNNGDTEKALFHYRKSVEISENNFHAWTNLGVLYSAIGEYGKSEQALKKAIGIIPTNYEAIDKLGITYMRAGLNQSAEKMFKTAIKMNKGYYPAYTHLGVLYAETGHYEEAAQFLELSIRINPYNAEGYFNLAALYEAFGRKEQAERYYQKAANLEPDKYS